MADKDKEPGFDVSRYPEWFAVYDIGHSVLHIAFALADVVEDDEFQHTHERVFERLKTGTSITDFSDCVENAIEQEHRLEDDIDAAKSLVHKYSSGEDRQEAFAALICAEHKLREWRDAAEHVDERHTPDGKAEAASCILRGFREAHEAAHHRLETVGYGFLARAEIMKIEAGPAGDLLVSASDPMNVLALAIYGECNVKTIQRDRIALKLRPLSPTESYRPDEWVQIARRRVKFVKDGRLRRRWMDLVEICETYHQGESDSK